MRLGYDPRENESPKGNRLERRIAFRQPIQIGYENPQESDYFEAIGRVNLYDLAVIANEDDYAFQNFFNTLPMCIMELVDGNVRFVRSNQSYRDFVQRLFGFDLATRDDGFSDSPLGVGSTFMSLVKQCCDNGSKAFFDEQMPDGKRIIIGVSIVDAQMKQQEASNRIQNEEAAYARIMALSGDYLSLYTIDPDTGEYYEYTSSGEFETLGVAKMGDDFFEQGIIDGKQVIHPEDLPHYLEGFARQNVLHEIEQNKRFQQHYRLMIQGKPTPVSLTIVPVRENGEDKLVAGIRAWRERRRDR